MTPEFSKLASIIKKKNVDLEVAAINVSKMDDNGHEMEVYRFPTIRFFYKKNPSDDRAWMEEYKG